MDEFFSLIDFVNPSSLAPSLSAFKRVYGDIIAHGRDRSASEDDKALGHERSQCASQLNFVAITISAQIFCERASSCLSSTATTCNLNILSGPNKHGNFIFLLSEGNGCRHRL